MQIFHDIDRDPWELNLTIKRVAAIEAAIGINLGLPELPGAGGLPLWLRLAGDIALAARIIWNCCHDCPTARTHKVDEENFYEDILTGETYRAAYTAFLTEYRDFFRRRCATDPKRFQTISETIEQLLTLANGGDSFGNGPVLSGLTPSPSPSANSPG